jgi:cytochrome c-type biogenesis protein CcmH
MKILLAALLFALSALPWAGEAQVLHGDAAIEARLNALSADLRCLVCQNQSIADSHAELAVDLRREILEMISAGKSDGEIIDFMVARYGDFVRYRPPFKMATVMLWGGPFALLVIALLVLYRYFRTTPREKEE